MRIDIVAVGSYGDVRPAVALGVGLLRDGHRVRIVTLDGFRDLVATHGLGYLAIAQSPAQIASTAAGQYWINQRSTARGFLQGFVTVAASLIETGVSTYWKNCQDVDAMLVTPMGLPVAVHIAERLGIPVIQIAYAPTRHDWVSKGRLFTAIGRDMVGSVFRQLIWMKLRGVTNIARRNVLSLPALPILKPLRLMDRTHKVMLEAYSPVVAPKRIERPFTHVTGFWFLEETSGWQSPVEVTDFLNSGPEPVLISFGSTPFPEPVAATDMVVKALTMAGQRGLILSGGSGLVRGRLADNVLSVNALPHSWVLPRVCAVVHHGGAGVTGAVLRAGLPSVVVPVFGDQPFWSERVFALGVGPRPVPAGKLTADALAAAIRLTSDTGMRHRASTLAEQIRGENGVARAVELIDHYLAVKVQRAS